MEKSIDYSDILSIGELRNSQSLIGTGPDSHLRKRFKALYGNNPTLLLAVPPPSKWKEGFMMAYPFTRLHGKNVEFSPLCFKEYVSADFAFMSLIDMVLNLSPFPVFKMQQEIKSVISSDEMTPVIPNIIQASEIESAVEPKVVEPEVEEAKVEPEVEEAKVEPEVEPEVEAKVEEAKVEPEIEVEPESESEVELVSPITVIDSDDDDDEKVEESPIVLTDDLLRADIHTLKEEQKAAVAVKSPPQPAKKVYPTLNLPIMKTEIILVPVRPGENEDVLVDVDGEFLLDVLQIVKKRILTYRDMFGKTLPEIAFEVDNKFMFKILLLMCPELLNEFGDSEISILEMITEWDDALMKKFLWGAIIAPNLSEDFVQKCFIHDIVYNDKDSINGLHHSTGIPNGVQFNPGRGLIADVERVFKRKRTLNDREHADLVLGKMIL